MRLLQFSNFGNNKSTTNKMERFNPLAYTDVPETAGLARSINP